LPGDGAGLVDVEVFGDDLAVVGLDVGAGAGELPGPGRSGVLLVPGGDPAVEREGGHSAAPSAALSRIRSSAWAAPGVRRGGSPGKTTRTASSSGDERRAVWAGPGLGLLSYGRFCDLGGAEQALFFIPVRPGCPGRVVLGLVSAGLLAWLRADAREG
jgi:hypothetical protein